jgi:hypothetical protein
MNDFIAGPASSTRQGGGGPGGGGAPPTVLIAALGAAILIAATLVGFLLGSGGGDSGTGGLRIDNNPGSAATTGGDAKRVVLTVQLDGAGSGRVLIDPSGSTCTDTCEHAFAIGTRVTLSPDADTDSKFEGWSDSCSGKDRCSVVMDRPRDITATFESAPSASPPDSRPAPVSDCHDGRDNDGDGLVDAAQDPDCAHGGMEAGPAAPSATTTTTTTTTTAPLPPPPPPPPSQCSDGRDNDGDGLIDRADPGCAAGGTEGGAQPVSQCRDGRDNDGDGLIDRPADPGCDADGTEAGG